ncbi:MAG: hypothetical protein C0478_16915, partial [Planctomyces sp.]|nr:hypothetical protein [Planctomyces sp.]
METRSSHPLLGQFGGTLSGWLFPPACALCRSPLEPSTSLNTATFCVSCTRELVERNAHYCPRCGAIVGPYSATSSGCIHCRADRLDMEHIWAIGNYEHLLSRAITGAKNGGLPLIRGLTELLWQIHGPALTAWKPDLIIPVPVQWWDRLCRSRVTTDEFAFSLSRHLGARLSLRSLRKPRKTTPQHRLSGKDRRKNIRNAHQPGWRVHLTGQRILLVDDVLTTGSTANDCIRV